MKLQEIHDISPNDILDFYGMVGSEVDWNEYREHLIVFANNLFENLNNIIKFRIVNSFAPMVKNNYSKYFSKATSKEMYEMGLGDVDLCTRISKSIEDWDNYQDKMSSNRPSDLLSDSDVDRVIEWFRKYQDNISTEKWNNFVSIKTKNPDIIAANKNNEDGMWLQAWSLIKRLKRDLNTNNINIIVQTTDKLIQFCHHDGTMLTYLNSPIKKPNGSWQYQKDEFENILNLKFSAKDITQFWNQISRPVKIAINKARYRNTIPRIYDN